MGTRETSISRKRKMGHGGGMNVCLFVMRGGEVMKWCQMEVCVYIRKKGMGKVYDRGKQAKKKVEPTGAIVGVNRGISKKSKKVLGVRWVKKKWYKEVKRREGWVAASRDREMHRA
jgi:hypothetical protein